MFGSLVLMKSHLFVQLVSTLSLYNKYTHLNLRPWPQAAAPLLSRLIGQTKPHLPVNLIKPRLCVQNLCDCTLSIRHTAQVKGHIGLIQGNFSVYEY